MTHSKLNYPKTLRENKEYRLDLIQRASKDKSLQALIRKKCQNDILFFVNVFGFTYDPRKEPSQIPFVTYGFQDDTLSKLVDCIENEKDAAVEKSRDMGFSWMLVALQVYGFIRGWSSLYGSYKQDYVDKSGDMDSHFERLRFFINLLPDWLIEGGTDQTFMKITGSGNASISGDAGANFGTGGRRKFIVMDEFALWQHDEKAFRKTKDISRCRILGGTPEGRYNVYGQIMTKGGEFDTIEIERIRLHWSLHPEKTQEWYEEEKKKRTKLDVAKELDISYDDSVTGAVYPEFNDRVTFADAPFNPKLPLFTAWDFGRDMNAIIWLQKDYYTNIVYLIDSYQIPNKPIEYMASFITGKPEVDEVTGLPYKYDDEDLIKIYTHAEWLPSYAFHCGDPYNASSLTTNATSSIKQKLASYNIHIKTNRKTSLEERIRKAHLALPMLIVDKKQMHFIQAMNQSRYPESTLNNTREKTKPIHDENSHFRTAFEYWCDNEPSNDPHKKTQRKKIVTYNPLTGKAV